MPLALKSRIPSLLAFLRWTNTHWSYFADRNSIAFQHYWRAVSNVVFSECFFPHLSGEGCQILCQRASSSSSSSSSPPRPPRPPRPQPRWCALSVSCRTSTAIVWVQCFLPDLNRDRVSSVFLGGPQPRSCEFSVSCRTSTAIVWVQCFLPDLNRDRVSSVFLAGPQPRSCEFSVSCRTSTAIVWVQCSVPDLNLEIECQEECQKICQKECQERWQKKCQKMSLLQSVCEVESNRTHFRR